MQSQSGDLHKTRDAGLQSLACGECWCLSLPLGHWPLCVLGEQHVLSQVCSKPHCSKDRPVVRQERRLHKAEIAADGSVHEFLRQGHNVAYVNEGRIPTQNGTFRDLTLLRLNEDAQSRGRDWGGPVKRFLD
eukprot:3099195-Amphidinium_carterae.1